MRTPPGCRAGCRSGAGTRRRDRRAASRVRASARRGRAQAAPARSRGAARAGRRVRRRARAVPRLEVGSFNVHGALFVWDRGFPTDGPELPLRNIPNSKCCKLCCRRQDSRSSYRELTPARPPTDFAHISANTLVYTSQRHFGRHRVYMARTQVRSADAIDGVGWVSNARTCQATSAAPLERPQVPDARDRQRSAGDVHPGSRRRLHVQAQLVPDWATPLRP